MWSARLELRQRSGKYLLEETNASGVAQADYICLNGRHAAVLNGSTLYYPYDDRLGTPQLATDSNQNIQWQASYDAFGQASVSGTVTQNVRLPGQYFDVESGWNHNGFRDYLPALGRYAEPDPLGRLGSGNNLYSYVYDNPVNLIDPLGLCNIDGTKDCIARALRALFPGVGVTVGDPTGNPNGGHWNFPVQLTFPSPDDANSFLSDYDSQGQAGFAPYTRYASGNQWGIGTTLHLEQMNNSQSELINSDGTVTLSGNAHLDLYDPDTGLAGMIGHGIIDGLIGHIADLLRRDIDPANCPW